MGGSVGAGSPPQEAAEASRGAAKRERRRTVSEGSERVVKTKRV